MSCTFSVNLFNFFFIHRKKGTQNKTTAKIPRWKEIVAVSFFSIPMIKCSNLMYSFFYFFRSLISACFSRIVQNVTSFDVWRTVTHCGEWFGCFVPFVAKERAREPKHFSYSHGHGERSVCVQCINHQCICPLPPSQRLANWLNTH